MLGWIAMFTPLALLVKNPLVIVVNASLPVKTLKEFIALARARKGELVYGTAGIGKSTFATCAPAPIVVQTEDGLGEIDCHKFPVAQSFDEFLQSLGALYSEDHAYRTVVIDSLDWLERLIWDAVCKRESATTIEKVGGG